METKKTAKSNLENKRILFFELGALTTLSLTLLAFEWTSSQMSEVVLKPIDNFRGTEEMIVTRTTTEVLNKLPPPPSISITLVSDDKLVPDDYIPIDQSDFSDIDLSDYFFNVSDEKPVDDIPYLNPQEWPKFNGKDIDEFRLWVMQNIRIPYDVAGTDIEGKVQVIFVVGKDGYIRDIKIYRSMTPSIEAELMRVLKSSPKWEPGRQFGESVSVQYSMPVKFVLN